MRPKISRPCFVILLVVASMLSAQDTHYRPDKQQISTPTCLAMKGAWEGGSKACTQDEHAAWLADIRHWRDERRIRIGYDGSRYDLPALKWTQVQFLPTADDGGRPLLLRSDYPSLYGGPVPR